MNNEKSIYDTPAADVTVPEQLPDAFTRGSLNPGKLRFAAFVSVLYFLILFPLVGFSFMEGWASDADRFKFWADALTLISMGMWIYLLLMFKAVLNQRLEYAGANTYIHILLVLSALMSVMPLFMDADESPFTLLGILFFAMMIPVGIITILFGRRLLAVAPRYKYLPLYAWTTILAGICTATVILFMLVLPLSLVSTIAMALIFLNASQELADAG